jgi:hypothetical protein
MSYTVQVKNREKMDTNREREALGVRAYLWRGGSSKEQSAKWKFEML